MQQHASWGDSQVKPNRLDHVIQVMANSILDFIDLLTTTAMDQLKKQNLEQSIFKVRERKEGHGLGTVGQ